MMTKYRLDYLFILILTLVYAGSYLDVGIPLDTARDLYKVNQIVSGKQLILQGPDLAGAIHLGPWWFYWLSLAGIFKVKSLIALWAGLTAGLKFVFAYALCKRLAGRRFALCTLFAMTLPGWQTIEQFGFSHTNLVQALTLLFFLLLWQLWETQNGKWLKWLAVVFTLAVHAHPSCYGLLLFALPFLLLALARRLFSLKDIVLSVLFVALLLSPYAVQQSMDGWHDFQTAGNFSHSQLSLSRILQMPQLVNALFNVGPLLFADVVAGSIQWWELLLRYVYLMSAVVALLGYIIGFFRKTLRLDRLALLLWGLFSLSASVLFIREITPFYMTYVLLPVVAMLIGYGLGQALQLVASVGVVLLGIACLSLALIASTWVAMIRFSQNDELVLPDKMLRQVRATLEQNWRNEANFRLDSMSFRQAEKLDDYLCLHQTQQLHGLMIPVLDLSFGVATQFQCDAQKLSISGNREGYALLGSIISSELEKSGYRLNKIANYAVVENVKPLKPVYFSLVRPNDYQHPPRKFESPTDSIHLSANLPAADLLMITEYFVYHFFPEPEVTVNGKLATPIAKNSYTRVYHCDGCQGEAAWQIDIDNVNQDTIDIVHFSLP